MKIFIAFCLYLLKSLPIVATALASDYMLRADHEKLFQNPELSRALCDNLGHALIATFTWLSVINYEVTDLWKLSETAVSFLAGSLIDLDHFLLARSLELKDALNLQTRPPLHNSSIVILLVPLHCIIWIFPGINPWYHQLLLSILTSIISHHLRDANRRGLWIWPFGSTPPLKPDFIYIFLITILPIFISYVKRHYPLIFMTNSSSRIKNVNVVDIV